MKKVRVNNHELLRKLRENRAKHADTYEKGMEVYREEAVEKLREMLGSAQDGGEIKTSLGLVEPVQHLDDYDRVIAMLEMSTETTVELEAAEFNNYVMDKWSWMHFFNESTASYAGKFRPLGR